MPSPSGDATLLQDSVISFKKFKVGAENEHQQLASDSPSTTNEDGGVSERGFYAHPLRQDVRLQTAEAIKDMSREGWAGQKYTCSTQSTDHKQEIGGGNGLTES